MSSDCISLHEAVRRGAGETPLDVALKLRNCFAVLALLETKTAYKCLPTKN